MAQAVKNSPAVPEAQETRVRSLGHGEGSDNPLQYSCLENPMDRGARWTIVQKITESDTTQHTHTHRQITDSDGCGAMVKNLPANAGGTGDAGQSLGWEDTLEKKTAIHSSILAWKIPWLEKPGKLQSTGSLKSQTRLSD